MAFPTDNELQVIKDKLVEGLTTDGAHHKQFYLEQILRFITSHDEFETLYEEWDWQESIAP
jgi:hypothetical protein